jgi:hypothetical protein
MYLPHNGTRFRLCEATLDAAAVLGQITKHHTRIGRGLRAETVKLLGVSRVSVFRLAAAGRLPNLKVGTDQSRIKSDACQRGFGMESSVQLYREASHNP